MKPLFIGTTTGLFIAMAATGAQAQSVTIDQLLNADVAKGEKLFKKCKACHTVNKDGKNKAGPNLYGVVGRDVAVIEGYKYSKALSGYGGAWTPERLDAFLEKPKAAVKGTKMGFAGLKKPDDRINLIAFLNAQSDTPLATSEQGAAKDAETAATDEEEPEFGVLVAAPGAETTFYTCSACHSERVVAYQGLTRDGWDELLDWMIDEQGMSEPDTADRTEILDYLEVNYNIDRPNYPKPIE
jgi:cytochrome c